MAKSVDLRKQAAQPPIPTVQPPKKPPREDRSGFRVVPPAGVVAPSPRPLPTGGVIVEGGEAPSMLPPHIHALAQQIQAEADAYVPPTSAQPAEPLRVETVDIQSLPPAEQAAVQQKIKDVLAMHADDPDAGSFKPVPGYRAPAPTVPTMPNPAAFPEDAGVTATTGPQVPSDATVEVDLPPASEQPPAAAKPQAFGGPLQTHCPHCRWDLAAVDIPEPEYLVKQAFLQSILGQKPFIQEYQLLGGAVAVSFRTLTTKEVDAIFMHVGWERERGDVISPLDHYERINRHRVYLSLVKLEAPGYYCHDLPDGLSLETNPNAEACWQLPEPSHSHDRGLDHIEMFMISQVLRTEMLLRAVVNKCREFNRLVAKLEDNIDNTDFWSETAPPS